MQETQIQSLGWESLLQKRNGNPLQYSCLENPWTEEPGRLQSMGLQRVRHDWANYAHYSDDICVGSFVFLGQLQRIAGGQGALRRRRGCGGQRSFVFLGQLQRIAGGQGALRRWRGCGGQPTSSSLPFPTSVVPEKPARAQGPRPALVLCVTMHVRARFPREMSQTTSLSKLRDVHNQPGNILLTAFSLFMRLSFFSSF